MFVLIFYRHRRGDDFRQLFGTGHRLNAITFDDRAGDTFAETLFAKVLITGRYRLLQPSAAIRPRTDRASDPCAYPAARHA